MNAIEIKKPGADCSVTGLVSLTMTGLDYFVMKASAGLSVVRNLHSQLQLAANRRVTDSESRFRLPMLAEISLLVADFKTRPFCTTRLTRR
jgi:hypothetical protein